MRILRGLILFLPVLGLRSVTSAQVGQPEKPPFTIIISTPQSAVKSGSDLKLRATMTNTSDRDVSYTVGPGPIINMEIRDAEGKPVPETLDGRRIHGTD